MKQTGIPGVLHVCKVAGVLGVPHVGEDNGGENPGLDSSTEPWLATLLRRMSMAKEMMIITSFRIMNFLRQIRNICKSCSDFQHFSR